MAQPAFLRQEEPDVLLAEDLDVVLAFNSQYLACRPSDQRLRQPGHALDRLAVVVAAEIQNLWLAGLEQGQRCVAHSRLPL